MKFCRLLLQFISLLGFSTRIISGADPPRETGSSSGHSGTQSPAQSARQYSFFLKDQIQNLKTEWVDIQNRLNYFLNVNPERHPVNAGTLKMAVGRQLELIEEQIDSKRQELRHMFLGNPKRNRQLVNSLRRFSLSISVLRKYMNTVRSSLKSISPNDEMVYRELQMKLNELERVEHIFVERMERLQKKINKFDFPDHHMR